MSREFKQTFFTSLLVVLLVMSNLFVTKLTNFLDLTIGVEFLIYPFTFLCTLLILNMGGKKSAYQAILISVLIQVFMTISYTLAVNLGIQTEIPDLAEHFNAVFKVNELTIIASLLSFVSSHYLLIYIYDNFKKNGYELYGVVIGLLGSLFLNTLIFQVLTMYKNDAMVVINALLSNLIISTVMIVIMTILYFLLKEKDLEVVKISNMDINVSNYKSEDKAIDEVLTESSKAKVATPKKTKPKKDYYRNNQNRKNNSNKKPQKKTTTKKTNSPKNSQTKVKKTDN